MTVLVPAGYKPDRLSVIYLALTFLPSHSPELQPAERLWTMVDEPIANQSFETLDDLELCLFHRCQSLLQQQDLIQGLTGFHWWIKIGA